MNCITEDDEGISPRGSSLNHLGRVALALKTSLTSVDAGIGKGDSLKLSSGTRHKRSESVWENFLMKNLTNDHSCQ